MPKLSDAIRVILQRQVNERGIVVWYDPEQVYTNAVEALTPDGVSLLKYSDSYFRLREELESWLEWIDEAGQPVAEKEVPPKLLVYVPLARADSQFALVEVETAGVVMEPGAPVTDRNTRLAGIVERVFAKFAPEKAGHVARQVEEGLLTFDEVEQMAEDAGSSATGALKLIFGQASPVEVVLRFVSTGEFDLKMVEKNALPELTKLVEEETGLSTGKLKSPLALREALVRHLLLGELALALPEYKRTGALALLELPEKPVQQDTLRHLCQVWRNRLDLQEAYANAAEAVEAASGISGMALPCALVSTLETFPKLDQPLLADAAEALLRGEAGRAALRSAQRRLTFWNRRSPKLQLQWSLVQVAAALFEEAQSIATALKKRKWALEELIAAYTSHSAPWMKLDTLARHLETRYARFDFEHGHAGPDWEKVVAKCRSCYLTTLELLTEAWTRGLIESEFSSSAAQPQTQVFKEWVAPLISAGRKTAYILVDALRYEMASELLEGLQSDFAIDLRPVLGQLPGITPVGMASLMPGAENGLSLEKQGGKMHVSLGERKITDRSSRMTWLQEQTGPDTLILKLGEIIRLTPKKKKELASAKFLVVTSQEIDRIGEGGSEDEEARIYMDDVLEKLRRGIRNLASIGVTDFVVAADHGFIFADGFETGLKMDAPGGDTVELHSRCWMGQGGTTANGYFRVAASTLELGGALECAFPRSLGTFKVKGGAGAYFHGGASAQEQLIPVASLTSKAAPSPKGGAAVISVTFGKKAITNRFFSVTLTMEGDEIFAPEKRQVRLEVIAGKEVIGQAAMAAYGFEEGTKEITLEPSQPNSITLMLAANSFPPMVLIRVTDSKNQSILATLADIPLNLSL
jgi:hypothetical protein